MEIFSIPQLNDIAITVIRTVIIFSYTFLLLRFLGRKRLSHLTYLDLLLLMSFGSAVGDVMIYGESDVHFFSSIIAITLVALLVKTFDELSSRSKTLGKLIEGDARLLIDKGKLLKDALDKENISEETLMSYLREKEIYSIKDVKKAFIEPDGEISVVPYARVK